MTEDRCQKSEVRGQKSEDRGQKTEDRGIWMRKWEYGMRKEITFSIPHSAFPLPNSGICPLFSVNK